MSTQFLPFEINHNGILFPFKAIQMAKLYYRNQFNNQYRDKRPEYETYGGEDVRHLSIYPETLDRMRKEGYLDRWTPVFKVKLTANSTLTFEGDKAIKLEQAYRAYLFAKSKKKVKQPKHKPEHGGWY